MSPTVAFAVVTWAAIALLFLGLGAVLRETRLLRGQLGRDRAGFTVAPPDLSFDGRLASGGEPQVVLVADSGCPLCLAAAERLGARRPGAVLLTHEPLHTWSGVADRLRVVSDREAWRVVSHLAPPVLMLVDGAGAVRRLVLPTREDEINTVLDEWTRGGIGGVIDARTDS
jgi:hypothetical protein